ncbi:unnamed protein product [Amoebophrya sp. A25]|nr:unnamed protein product [Amoebophrya sp. A25]|eukprot:GSA25T00012355001.1
MNNDGNNRYNQERDSLSSASTTCVSLDELPIPARDFFSSQFRTLADAEGTCLPFTDTTGASSSSTTSNCSSSSCLYAVAPTLRCSLGEAVLILAEFYNRSLLAFLNFREQNASSTSSSTSCILRLSALSQEALEGRARRAFLSDVDVLAQLTLSALSIALVRLSVSALADLRNGIKQGDASASPTGAAGKSTFSLLELALPPSSSSRSSTFQNAISKALTHKQSLLKSPLVIGPNWGAIGTSTSNYSTSTSPNAQGPDFRWIRQSTSKDDRCRRMVEMMRTLQAAWSLGYCHPETGELQALRHANFCAEKTEVIELLATGVENPQSCVGGSGEEKFPSFLQSSTTAGRTGISGPSTTSKTSSTTTSYSKLVQALGGADRVEVARSFLYSGTLEEDPVPVVQISNIIEPAQSIGGTESTAITGGPDVPPQAQGGGAADAGAATAGGADQQNKSASSCCCGPPPTVLPPVKAPDMERLGQAFSSPVDAGARAGVVQSTITTTASNANTFTTTTTKELDVLPASQKKTIGKTQVTVMAGAPRVNTTVMDLARLHAESGKRVVALSAAAGYSVGGGSLTGSRHALEESWCLTTTLMKSLLHAEFQMAQRVRRRTGADVGSKTNEGREAALSVSASGPADASRGWGASSTDTSSKSNSNSATGMSQQQLAANPKIARGRPYKYLPTYGCVMSPRVEVFRKSAFEGYRFLAKPVVLDGVVSLAAFNCNAAVSDSPLDAPTDPAAYQLGLRRKWFVALATAAFTFQHDELGNAEADSSIPKAKVLVVPDIGCGVFKNPPEDVGAAFFDMLSKFFVQSGIFDEVILCGGKAFCDAAAGGGNDAT